MRSTSFLFVIALLAIPTTAQSVVEIPALKDNTLYEDATGALSNGAGESLFAGLTAKSEVRRALVAFDMTSIPTGVLVDSVQVQLTMTKSLGTTETVLLYRLTQSFGEGASNAPGEEGAGTAAAAGDATWLHAVRPGTSWSAPGGDFVPTASASRSISIPGTVVWYSTAALVADVSAWLADPSQNFGWIVVGNEESSGSAMRFASRQHTSTSERPLLRVFYSQTATFTEQHEQPSSFAISSAWPNPFTSDITLSMTSDRTENVQLEVVDVHGRTVLHTQRQLHAGGNDLSLDGSAWSPGVYWIRVMTESDTVTRPVVRLR